MISLDLTSALPIWSQIEDGVRRLVALGTLAPGSVVPSVREMARELRVNPATVAKAYQRLGDEGVLEVRRGEGTFVCASPPRLDGKERRRLLAQAAERYVHQAITLGADEEESMSTVEAVIAQTLARRGEA